MSLFYTVFFSNVYLFLFYLSIETEWISFINFFIFNFEYKYKWYTNMHSACIVLHVRQMHITKSISWLYWAINNKRSFDFIIKKVGKTMAVDVRPSFFQFQETTIMLVGVKHLIWAVITMESYNAWLCSAYDVIYFKFEIKYKSLLFLFFFSQRFWAECIFLY